MENPWKFALIVLFAVRTTAAQTPAGQTALGPNQLQTQIRRLANGKPDLSGIWQALNTANWDLEGQGGGPSPVVELGAIGDGPPPWPSRSQFAVLRACQMPLKSGLPFARRRIWVCSWFGPSAVCPAGV